MIQGRPGQRASDGFGDVTIMGKLRVIDALPSFALSSATHGGGSCQRTEEGATT